MTPAVRKRELSSWPLRWESLQDAFANIFDRTVVQNALLGLSLLYLAMIAFPASPHIWGAELDGSWVIGMNLAHREGLVHGRDIFWTYGPLGWLRFYDGINGGFGWNVLYRFTFYTLWLVAAGRLVLRHESKFAAIWAIGLLAIAATLDFPPDHLEFAVIAVTALSLSETGRGRGYATLTLAGLAAMSALVKLNDGIAAALVFASIVAVNTFRDRGATKAAFTRIASWYGAAAFLFAVFYFAATGNLRGLLSYLRYGSNLAAGFSLSMSLPGPLWQLVLAAVTMAGSLVCIPLGSGDLRSLVPGWMPAALLAFFSFKQGMIRQDGHAAGLQLRLALATIPLLIVAKTRHDRYLFACCQAACVLLAWSIMEGTYPGSLAALQRNLTLQNIQGSVSAYTHPNRTAASLNDAANDELRPLRMDPRYAKEIGSASIDVIPWDIARIRANNWNWRPRPVIQSYAAYTPELDALNADYLMGASAPQFVLLHWGAIDGRHPFLEDPLTWRVLLERYDLRILDEDVALLCLRSKKRPESLRLLKSFDARWDAPIVLPDTGHLIVIKANVSPSLYGAVRNAAYRTDSVYLVATMASGAKVAWRTVWPNLAEGFIAARLPRSLIEYVCVFGDSRCGERVTSISFRASAPKEFAPVISMHMYDWDVHDVGEPTRTATPRPEGQLIELWSPRDKAPINRDGTIEFSPSGLTIRPTGIDPQLVFDLHRPLNDFQAIVVRARFSRSDRIDLFFGRQVDGRGVNGVVPQTNQWLDIYFFTARNPYWPVEAGSSLRFDPASELGIGSTIEIAGLWGFKGSVPNESGQVVFSVAGISDAHQKSRTPPQH
jgi:hypothetical protein